MNCENIKEKMVELLDNSLKESECLELESHLQQCDGCRAELESLKQVWQDMEQLPVPEPGETMKIEFYAMLKAYKNEMRPTPAYSWEEVLLKLKMLWTPQLALRFTYSLCLFAFGLLTGYWYNNRYAADRNYKQEISVLSSEVQEMRQIMLLSLIENPSATERLKAVGYTKDIAGVNKRVVEALLSTLNNDPNVNVRLATLDALSQLAGNPRVRQGLVQALTRQNSPLVQSALVDLMVTLQEKQSVKKLRQLLKNEGLNILVKDKIEKSIQALS